MSRQYDRYDYDNRKARESGEDDGRYGHRDWSRDRFSGNERDAAYFDGLREGERIREMREQQQAEEARQERVAEARRIEQAQEEQAEHERMMEAMGEDE